MQEIADAWVEWMEPQANEMFKKFGFFSQDLKLKDGKAVPSGSRVICLNTTAYAPQNWFTWGQREDPSGQYEWFEKELKEIEEQGGLALLLFHHNPSTSMHQYSLRFRALIERYQHVVRVIATGHDHRLFFNMF